MKFILPAVLGFAVLAGGAQAPASYLCTTEHTTGFSFDKTTKEWKVTTFANGRDVIVSHTAKGSMEDSLGVRWIVKLQGSILGMFFCRSEFTSDGDLVCDRGREDGYFAMNKGSLRFQAERHMGYWDSGPGIVRDPRSSKTQVFGNILGTEGSVVPFMAIGKCKVTGP